jgi:hypothetical protein
MANKYPIANGTTLTTDNFNDAPRTLELMMQAVDNGISSTTDYEQNASLLTTYINAADFFEDTGIVNAYNLIADSGRYEVYKNINGGLIRFRPQFANTGASTVAISGKPAVNLLTEGGTPLTGGELSPNKDAYIRYNGTAYLLLNTGLQSQVETNAADIATNTSDIATLQGLVIPSSATTQGLSYLATKVNLTYTSPTSFTYSVINVDSKEVITNGTINLATVGVDGLDVGALAINTTYHIFEIKNLTSNIVKTITSTSLVSPTLPSGFTIKKHIFSFITNASSQLRPMQVFNIGYNQYYVSYTNPIVEFSPISVLNTGTNLQLTIPSGVTVKAFLGVRAFNISASNISIGVAPPHVINDTTTNSTFNVWFGSTTGAQDGGNEIHSFTDTDRTVRFFGRTDITPTSLSIVIFTKGYYLYL